MFYLFVNHIQPMMKLIVGMAFILIFAIGCQARATGQNMKMYKKILKGLAPVRPSGGEGGNIIGISSGMAFN